MKIFGKDFPLRRMDNKQHIKNKTVIKLPTTCERVPSKIRSNRNKHSVVIKVAILIQDFWKLNTKTNIRRKKGILNTVFGGAIRVSIKVKSFNS